MFKYYHVSNANLSILIRYFDSTDYKLYSIKLAKILTNSNLNNYFKLKTRSFEMTIN